MKIMKVLAVLLSCYCLAARAQNNGDLRLRDGLIADSGRVEIYMNGVWGTVMYDTYNQQGGVGQTICKQLGYQDESNVGPVSNFGIPEAADNVPVHIQNVYCTYYSYPPNANNHVLRCGYSVSSSNDHSNDMAVTCTNFITYGPYDTEVRLVQSGNYKSSGFVEVYLHDLWGPVCNLESNAANSVCRQLGYTNALDFSSNDGYNRGYGDLLNGAYECGSSQPCFRRCFDYPSLGDTAYCTQHTWVNCTFDLNNSYYSAGGYPLCDTSLNVVVISVGIVIACIVLLLLIIIPAVICCCCIPGCILHSSRRRVVYQTIS